MKKNATVKTNRPQKAMTLFRSIKAAKCMIAGCLMLLAGCAVGPDYKKPEVEVPESYRFKPEAVEEAVNLKWWDLFEDPFLYDLVTSALENNRDLQIAASRVLQARAALGFVRADQYPKLDVEAGALTGNTLSPSGNIDDGQSSLFIVFPLSYEIDFWGKFRRATASARAELLASQYGLRAVQISLIAEVVGTYYQLLDFKQRLAISQKTLESRLDSLTIIQDRFIEGIIPELDLNQAQIQKEIAAAAIPQFERAIAQTENALNILVGKLPASIKTGTTLDSQSIPPDIPTGLPASLLERRPDIARAEALLKAQTEQIGVAVALRLPAISLTGLVGAASNELAGISAEGGVWQVGGSLLGPVYNFEKNVRRVDIETEKTRQALFNYQNTVLTAFREVEDALVEIDTYKRQIAAISNQQKAAANANTLSKDRYDQGVTSYLEVLETERQLFNADLELSELTRQYLNAYVNLYKALGGGWVSKEAMQTAGEPDGDIFWSRPPTNAEEPHIQVQKRQ
jgi:multidrug efflux system outer membrane protein